LFFDSSEPNIKPYFYENPVSYIRNARFLSFTLTIEYYEEKFYPVRFLFFATHMFGHAGNLQTAFGGTGIVKCPLPADRSAT